MIYHIAYRRDFEKSLDEKTYKPLNYDKEGFIHCSPISKLTESANKFFKDMDDIIIICIDESKVVGKIIREDLYNTGFPFPHIYSALNIDSITAVLEFKTDERGNFILPDELSEYK